jgi:hypothetical protein
MSRWLAALVAALCCAVSISCTEGGEDLEGECVERLVWKGRDYGGDSYRPRLGDRLGRTATLDCDGSPNRRITVFSIPAVSPSVAIAVKPDGDRRFLGLGPGYIVESPRHPLHSAVFGSKDRPDVFRDQRCRPHRVVLARAVTTPVYGTKWLTVAAERPADRPYLRGRGVRGTVTFDATTALDGLERNGAPYIATGDRLRLTLRACRFGPEADPGLRGIASLVVVRAHRRGR